MKKILQALGILLFIICSNNTMAQPSTISDDKDWSAQVGISEEHNGSSLYHPHRRY
ncbi:MAG: hypothetical protein V9E88_10650 [Ferruginibacter sp.]